MQRFVAGLCIVWLSAFCAPAFAATADRTFDTMQADDERVVVEWREASVRAAAAAGAPIVVADFPLRPGRVVDLRLAPFSITGERTRFVLGRKNAPDRPLDFDPATLALFRGTIAGKPGSRVFLALGDGLATGSIDPGDGTPGYRLSSRDDRGAALAPGQTTVFETHGQPNRPPGVPLCGVDLSDGAGDLGSVAPPAPRGGMRVSADGPRQMELAVETDFEFYSLYGDATAAAAYLVALYAEISEIYVNNVDTRIELVFARIWDQPEDLFNDVEPTPLPDFRDYWNDNMGAVDRDVAQLLSGRRDYPFGGQGYLSSICGSNGYSVVGYLAGFFPDPTRPNAYHYDIAVAAHELGHNSGTGHTHDPPNNLDSCQDPLSTPQRGTIMSYCSQTWSGGASNKELYFHTRIRENMNGFLSGAACLAQDCNGNGIDDATDIQIGTSLDVNGTAVPDECEDCNNNSVLDDADIAGSSLDLNTNGVPDECEPDCDASGVPDDLEIEQGTLIDLHGNAVPDVCDPDCDGDSTADYNEIQADMTLDVNRDIVLDACEDCDGDGTVDALELDSAHNVFVASGLSGSGVMELHGVTGVRVNLSGGGPAGLVDEGQDVLITVDGRVLVSSAADSRILEFDRDGNYLGDFAAAPTGGLSYPTGMILAPNGSVLVSSRDTDKVLEFDAANGAFLGDFVSAADGGLDAPFGLAIGPHGNLFVTSATNAVLEYDGSSGSFVGSFVNAANNGGLDQPRGLVFKPDGNLLVASFGTDEVLEFETGSGAPMGKWAQVGTASVLNQVSPWGIRIGPNGNVFVARTGEDFGSGGGGAHEEHDEDEILEKVLGLHLSNTQIYEFDVRNGNFLRAYVGGNDHGLSFPSGFAFFPGWTTDCNFDLLPDDCNIASATSDDLDLNGVPDECEIDCNSNATQDRLDIVPYGTSFDCNDNSVPDECDIAAGTSRDCNSDDVPDECQVTDDLEATAGWTIGAAGDDASAGVWVLVDPNGTEAQPEDDHTPGSGTTCFVTGQGSVGGGNAAADVDGGKTTLISPAFDLDGDVDAEIGYWRWYSNDTGGSPGHDLFLVDVTSDGASWFNVETIGPDGPGTTGGWVFHSFRVADFTTPGSTVQLRFVAEDAGGGSVVEAGVDDLIVVASCAECQADPDCDDGAACSIDTCNPAGQCEHLLPPDSCLIDGSCFTDGELNPANDCEGCDPAAPDLWSSFPPQEVDGLLIDDAQTELTWAEQTGAIYDVIGGTISVLRSEEGVVSAACLVEDLSSGSWIDARPGPPLGVGEYYLVRSEKSCGTGSYGKSSAAVERIPAAGCP